MPLITFQVDQTNRLKIKFSFSRRDQRLSELPDIMHHEVWSLSRRGSRIFSCPVCCRWKKSFCLKNLSYQSQLRCRKIPFLHNPISFKTFKALWKILLKSLFMMPGPLSILSSCSCCSTVLLVFLGKHKAINLICCHQFYFCEINLLIKISFCLTQHVELFLV